MWIEIDVNLLAGVWTWETNSPLVYVYRSPNLFPWYQIASKDFSRSLDHIDALIRESWFNWNLSYRGWHYLSFLKGTPTFDQNSEKWRLSLSESISRILQMDFFSIPSTPFQRSRFESQGLHCLFLAKHALLVLMKQETYFQQSWVKAAGWKEF